MDYIKPDHEAKLRFKHRDLSVWSLNYKYLEMLASLLVN